MPKSSSSSKKSYKIPEFDPYDDFMKKKKQNRRLIRELETSDNQLPPSTTHNEESVI